MRLDAGRATGEFERVEPNLTSMIDICFMIIIFFIANMRILLPEGDFFMKMPPASGGGGPASDADAPVLVVRLQADKDGNLAGIQMGERKLATCEELRRQIREIVQAGRDGTAAKSQAEVKIDCDYNLSFDAAMDALSAISGYVADDKQTIVRMIEKISFSPPKKPAS